MSIAPKSSREFSDPNYWKEFFRKCGTAPFEWYGDWDVFGDSLDKYLKASDKILQLGCGNSLLAGQLYDNGYLCVKSIDIDESVIQRQKKANKDSRPELLFECSSASKLQEEDQSVNVVLDKGLLDALCQLDSSGKIPDIVSQMFSEVRRVLAFGGRYIVISLAQDYILRCFLEMFNKDKQYVIRVQKVRATSDEFPMPVFLLIATKLRIPLPNYVMEFSNSPEAAPQRVGSIGEICSLAAAEQEVAMFCQMCRKRLPKEATILISSARGANRYELTIVDTQEKHNLTSYAVFIIPIGRERDWIFSTPKGRMCLRADCGKDRLLVARLFRDQKYADVEEIKDELHSIALSLKPVDCRGQIDYLSLGEVDVKESRASGESALSGSWIVEDVNIAGSKYRRLIFTSNSFVIQSEALIVAAKDKMVVNYETLTSEYLEAMLLAFAFLDRRSPIRNHKSSAFRIAVLGVGGGVLTSFLYRMFPKSMVIGIELDGDVIKIARKWFGLPQNDSRLSVKICNALQFLDEASRSLEKDSERYDVIFLDVGGPVQENGLSCPLPAFLEREVLNEMYISLKNDGILAVNVVTRDDELSEEIKKDFAAVFPAVFEFICEKDINKVLICPKGSLSLKEVKKVGKSIRNETNWLGEVGRKIIRLQEFRRSGN
ncbi:hypothetical protein AB6A40_006863 [Gnathostoma spinigerum]|uniref:Methyltransferase domain-containing protein n=1 Tax=Gnathostoma spinigerum TaxID=75299 RepID=A0ABD6EPR0_9BILA